MRISRHKVYRNMSGVTISAAVVSERLRDVLRAEYGELRHAAERLARKIGCDPRAARNWLYGINAPRLADAIELAAECEAVADEINRLIIERRKQRACSPST